MKTKLITVLIIALIITVRTSICLAQFVAPGKLTESHKSLSGITKCVACHTLGKGIPDSACKSCHEKLVKRMKENKGFHSKVAGHCIECHTEHKGEDFNIMPINSAKFDHSQTGFTLEDKHIINCSKCHKKEKTFLGLTTDCLNCHTDVHLQTLSDCLKCHTYKGWKNVQFNHDGFAKFNLTGKHREVKCEVCHPQQTIERTSIKADNVSKVLKFKPLKYESCDSCHQRVHKDNMKNMTCESCHSTKGWKETIFDHSDPKLSDFQLVGSHAEASCELCHPEEKTIVRTNGKEVEKSVKKLKPIKHALCNDCHFDVHKGQFKDRKCDSCHTAREKWKDITFKHDAPEYKGFSLDGRHKEIKCDKCHQKNETKFKEFNKKKKLSMGKFKPLKSDKCNDCHKDFHKDVNSKQCESCHSTKGWKETIFDHGDPKLSDFQLVGSHAKASCELCHPEEKTIVRTNGKEVEKSVKKLKPIKHALCNDCHFDVHKGQFKDRKCDSCHTAREKWKDVTFKHDAPEYKGFSLDGNHKEVKCEKCHQRSEVSFDEFNIHKTVTIGKLKAIKHENCNDCHYDVHQGHFKDRKCESCHTVLEKWENVTFKHNEKQYKGFKLEGKHQNVACEKCHSKKEIQFTEFGTLKQVSVGEFRSVEYKSCVSCHEDKHNGKYEKACEKCHVPDGWEPKMFLHDPLTAELQGVHNTLSCVQCHKQIKNYKGLDSSCTSCHRDVHFNQFGRFCGDCHRQQSWVPTNFKHTGVGFRLVGGHRKAECTDCHKNGDYRNTPTDCFVCHQADYQTAPNHVASGYPHDCMECHQISAPWEQASFNHESFTFSGAHASLKGDCLTCHASSGMILAGTTDSDCYNCHATAGVATTTYEGVTSPSHVTNSFSKICTDCHANTAWIPASYTHNSFQFSGVHGTLSCTTCHTNGYPGPISGITADNCYACHASNYQSAPNHVTSSYPQDCTACHSTSGTWANVTAYSHTTFTFSGAHAAIKTTCTECHGGSKTIPGGTTDSDCYNCHATAGVATTTYEGVTSPSHVTNSFSKICTDCHANTAWIPASYTHNSFQFSGVHGTLSCTTCHTNGYPGSISGITADNCYACHASNYQTAPNHVASGYPHDCTSCHSTTTWQGATVHQTFQFIYRHGTLSCSSCHSTGYPGQYAGVSETDCYACHANDYRKEHTTCSHECTLCHNGNNWNNPKSKNGCN
ncbi:MAG: hypothetical protein AB1499_01330 [Nitrospirota bacterium]